MYELVTAIIVLALAILLIRYVLGTLIPEKFMTWVGFGVFLVVLAVAFLRPDNHIAGIFWGILSFPFRPLGLTILLLGFGLADIWLLNQYKYRRLWGGYVEIEAKKTIQIIHRVPQVLAAMLILVIFSLPITAYFLTAQTEQRTALEYSQRPITSSVEAIIVLGDGTSPSDPVYRVRTQLSNPENGLSISLEARLSYAARLYEQQASQGSNPLMVVTAGPQSILAIPGLTSVDVITAYLARLGVPSDRIRVDVEAYDPRSSAITVRKILLGPDAVAECSIFAVCENGDINQVPTSGPDVVVPVVVVTPAIMLRRAVSSYAKLNLDAVPRPTDFYVFQIQGGLQLAAFTDFIPNAEALAITTRVIDEYLAWVYYFLRGWLRDPLGI